MQRLTVGTSTVLLDDETARAILWYARILGDAHRVECVELAAYDVESRSVTVQFLLGAGIPVTSMTAFTDLDEPDNTDVRARIKADTAHIEHPPFAAPVTEPLPGHDIDGV